MSETENRNRLRGSADVPGVKENVRSTTPSAPSTGPISFIEVPLDERLADNPLNARRSVSELDGLEASIRNRGLLQPLIVARAEVFRLARPEASVDNKAEWVLLAGHRRRAAARRAGMETAIAIVRDDLAKNEDSATVALAENVHRSGLSPLEEARILCLLKDLGLSQREISRQTGISQGQVSKRMQLLDLPTELQDRIHDGALKVADALTILHELGDPQDQLRAQQLSQDGKRSLKHVLSQLRRERVARGVVAEQTPGQDGKISGEAPEEAALDDSHVHDSHVTGEGQRPEVSSPTAVIGAKPALEENGTGIGESQEGLEPHAAASSARIEACRRAVRSGLNVEQIVDVLVDATLDPPMLRSAHARDQAHSMAAEWTATILPKDFDASAPYNLLLGTQDAAQWLAVAIVFAHREIDLASAVCVQPWSEAARRHVRRLAAWGVHIPTAYEHARLTGSSANEGRD